MVWGKNLVTETVYLEVTIKCNALWIGYLPTSFLQPSPLSKNCTYPEWAQGLAKSLWTLHIQHTTSLNCYRLVDATELWAPERPDTGTVSSLMQSISWTLDIKHTTQLYITFSSHILLFHFKFAHIRPVHTSLSILYIVFMLFCTLPICVFVCYSCPVLLLSFCCTVELLSL